MLELFKMAIQKPLNAIVVALCTVVITMQMEMFEVREAIAVMQTEQIVDKQINDKVLSMSDTLTRIDVNVETLKGYSESVVDYSAKVEYLLMINRRKEKDE